MIRKSLFITAAMLGLAGCQTMPRGATTDTEPLDKILNRIKADLTGYNAYAAAHANDEPLNNACNGSVKLEVTGVALQLATVTEKSVGGSLGAEVPIGPVTLGLGASRKYSTKNSQTLNFKLIPSPLTRAEVAQLSPIENQGPFSKALIELRESLLKSSGNTPCFTFPDGDDDNSIEFGFNLVREKGGEGKISFLIFSIGGENSSSRDVGNTITVKFTGKGSAMMPM
ncbi:MAG: trypco2 family protein [Sphingorhabdus sp.]